MAANEQGALPGFIGGIWQRWRQRSARVRAARDAAHAIYVELVGLARQPVYFMQGGVPDTNDGRLEMVGLHVALMARRLAGEGRDGRALARLLVELMFADIDRNLRELGVGDLSVGKKMKGIASSFRGRSVALEAAIAASDRVGLATILLRNLYLSGPMPDAAQVLLVVDRLFALEVALDEVDGNDLLAGRLSLAKVHSGQGVDRVSARS